MRLLLSLPLLAAVLLASGPPAEPIWPKGAPNDPGVPGEEKDATKPTDNIVGGRKVVRLGNVNNPTISIYRAPKEKDTGAAVVVFPGGGYSILAIDLEGVEVCEWLNSIGITGVLLKYRVPARKDRPRWAAPLEDAQRAVGVVRSRAGELGLKPDRIGVLGFSAGGHLAAALSTNYMSRAYSPVDERDQVSCRPDFTMLIYPAYLTVRDENDRISPALKIDASAPPTFLIQTEDDAVCVENSIFYYAALRKARVPAEMHIYPVGGHGYGLRRTDKLVTTWPSRAGEWLQSLGILKQ